MLEMATISMRGDVHFNGERMSGIPRPSAIVYDGGEGHFWLSQGKSNIDANHFIFGRNLLAATPTVEVAAQVEIFPSHLVFFFSQ